MRTRLILSASLIAAALTASARAAAPLVYANVSNLIPDPSNVVQLQLFIAGTDIIMGENLNFQINNGGYGPTFTDVNIVSGTIFGNSNTGQNYPNDTTNFDTKGIYITGTLSHHLAVVLTTTVGSAVATDNGLLATLTFSTAGATSNTFTLNMINTLNGASNVVGTYGSSTTYVTFPHCQFSIADSARQWAVNGGGAWDTDTNWSPFAPRARSDAANFLNSLTSGTATVILDAQRAVGTVNFNNTAGTYDLQPGSGGSLLLDNGSQSPLIAALAGTHRISAPIILTAGTNVSVLGGSTLTLGGGVSGTASALSLSGSGRLILTGANSYGATSIAVGATMQVGNGTASGSLGTAAVSNSGSLLLTNLGAPLAVPLTGPGSMTVSGTTHLDSTDSLALTTITSTGLLEVDTGGALIGGSVVNGGVLAFNRPDAFTHTSTISGSGTLTHIGPGITTLSGAANYGGPTILSAGRLDFAGGVSHTIAGVSGTGSLSVAASTVLTSDGVNLPAGSLIVAGTQAIRSSAAAAYAAYATGSGATVLSGTSKVSVLNTTGSLDIKNNALIIQTANTTSKAALLAAIANTASGMLVTGAITSSSAASNVNYTLSVLDNGLLGASTFGGLPVTPTSVIVTETLKGDATMDGSVDLLDLARWKANAGHTNVYSPVGGDMNGDGGVDLLDLAMWKANAGHNITTNPAPSDFLSGGLGTLGAPALGGGASPVPEPASLAVLAPLFILLTRKRVRGPSNYPS